ncbi:MAG: hypothetical protein ACJ798_03155 [Phenylobacterium sp.]
MAARLKVFVTSDGLTDYVVAVSSKAKALAAWGLRQDVFKEGRARETDDPALVKAATARPGEVLRRPAGTRGKLEKLKSTRRAEPKGPSKAQLKRVADLEARLARAAAEGEAARAGLAKEEAVLAKKRDAVEARLTAARARLEARLAAARAALA